MGYWNKYILKRIDRDRNFICFISGETGSGKSLSGVRLCETLDPDFTIKNIVFNGLELIRLINSGELKKGGCILFDEAGVEMDSRNWQSATNKALNHLFQTFRHKNFILFFTAPFLTFLDKVSRSLVHAEFETKKIDRKRNRCVISPKILQTNTQTGKVYRKYLRVPRKKNKITRLYVQLPSPPLLKAYTEKKNEYTDKLNEQNEQLLLREYNKRLDKINPSSKPLTEQQAKIATLLKEGSLIPGIAAEIGVSKPAIRSQIILIKKKGVQIIPNKDGNKVIDYKVLGL